MTHHDLIYFRQCALAGLISAPFLEVGSAKHENVVCNLCDVAKEYGITQTKGADLSKREGVDFIFDFSIPCEEFRKKWAHGKFGSVAIFNTLEHTFDPVTVLSNALYCVRPGGTLLVLVPSVWPIHSYPQDYQRLLPHWFEKFAETNGLEIIDSAFSWLSEFGISSVRDNPDFPSYMNSGMKKSPPKYWKSRILHRLFNTYGRSHWATHVCTAVTYRVPLSTKTV